jgi:hypothetical protein
MRSVLALQAAPTTASKQALARKMLKREWETTKQFTWR